MAGGPDPVAPGEGRDESESGSRFDASGSRPTRLDQAGLVEAIAAAQDDPPVGLIIVGWERPDPMLAMDDTTYGHQVERSVAFAVAGCAGRSDRILASTDAEVAVVRSTMSGPATAEALAHRIATTVDAELERLAIAAGQTAARWAIGVAVSRPGDRAADLLRYAETALDDAWLLGGRRLVAFDDGDRELLDRPTQAD